MSMENNFKVVSTKSRKKILSLIRYEHSDITTPQKQSRHHLSYVTIFFKLLDYREVFVISLFSRTEAASVIAHPSMHPVVSLPTEPVLAEQRWVSPRGEGWNFRCLRLERFVAPERAQRAMLEGVERGEGRVDERSECRAIEYEIRIQKRRTRDKLSLAGLSAEDFSLSELFIATPRRPGASDFPPLQSA